MDNRNRKRYFGIHPSVRTSFPDRLPSGTICARIDEFGQMESVDSLLKRFRGWLSKNDVMKDMNKNEFHQTKSQKRREKRRRALHEMKIDPYGLKATAKASKSDTDDGGI